MPLKASLTDSFVTSPSMVSSDFVAISAATKPIWLNEPTAVSGAYFAMTERHSVLSGPVESTRFSSALMPSLSFHCSPSASEIDLSLHGVAQAHFTLSMRPCCSAPCRIFSASGGVNVSTTPPPSPAACGRASARRPRRR